MFPKRLKFIIIAFMVPTVSAYGFYFWVSISILLCGCNNNDYKTISGEYINRGHNRISLILFEDSTYKYEVYGRTFNTGKWAFEKRWAAHVYLHGWKDYPQYEIAECEDGCIVIPAYRDGSYNDMLIFHPDLSSLDFIKIDD